LSSIDSVESHAEIDENSYATVIEISQYRRYGLIVEPVAPAKAQDVEIDPDDRVTAATLQDENRPRGHSGGRSKRKRTETRPLSPEQRMDRRCRILRDTGPDAFLAETETQQAERRLHEETRRLERSQNKGGRPRKGAEVREMYGVRLEPELVAHIKNTTALDLAAFIEQQAATLYGGSSTQEPIQEQAA
jgi:hypothetical protein